MSVERIHTNQTLQLLKDSVGQKEKENLFDLDIDHFHISLAPKELITSKSLCTPGCGNTGTGNSFCC